MAGTNLAVRMDDVEAHLAIDGEKGLIADEAITRVGSGTTSGEKADDIRGKEALASGDVLFADGAAGELGGDGACDVGVEGDDHETRGQSVETIDGWGEVSGVRETIERTHCRFFRSRIRCEGSGRESGGDICLWHGRAGCEVKQRGGREREKTHYAAGFIDDEKMPVPVMKNDGDGVGRDGGLVSVDDIPVPWSSGQTRRRMAEKSYSMRSPSLMTVSGVAGQPLMEVMPDWRAYRYGWR